MAQVNNIQSGIADIWIKTHAIDSTNNPFGSNAIDTTGYTQLGFQSEEGFTIDFEEDGNTLASPEVQGDIEYEPTRRGYTVTVTLDESDVNTMKYANSGFTYAAGATPGTNPDTLGFGTGNARVLYSLLLIDFGADAAGVVGALGYYCRKCTAVSGPTQVFNKQGFRKTAITFRGLVDRADSVAATQDLVEIEQVTTA